MWIVDVSGTRWFVSAGSGEHGIVHSGSMSTARVFAVSESVSYSVRTVLRGVA